MRVRKSYRWEAIIPVNSVLTEPHPDETRVIMRMAQGSHSTGISIMKNLTFLPRLSWA